MNIIVYISLLIMLSTTALAAEWEQENNRKLVRYYAGIMKVDEDFCDAIAQIESAYKTKAFNNPKKPLNKETWISRGIMQLTFETGQKFNKKIREKTDLYHAENNIIAGINFIKYLFKKYPEESYENIAQIYNLGETKFLQGIRNQSYANKFRYVFHDLKYQFAYYRNNRAIGKTSCNRYQGALQICCLQKKEMDISLQKDFDTQDFKYQ